MNHETLAAYALGAIAKGWTPSREDLELFAASDVSDPRDAMQIGAIHAIEKAFKWVHEKNLAKLGYVRVPGATGTKPAKGGGNLVLARKGSELRDKAEKLGLNKKAEAVADKPVGPSPSDLRSELKAKLAESDSRVEAETKRLSREKSKARGARKDEIEAEWRAMKDRESELRSKLLDEFHKKYAEHPDVIAEKKKTSEMAKRMQSEASEAEARDKGIEDKRDWDAIQERGGVDSVKAGLAKELVKAKANLARAASRNKWKYEGPVERVQRNIDRVDYLADKYGKAEPKPAAQLRTEDKPKEMSPEEKEIADTVAEHKSRDMARTTPRKGESARKELEDAAAAAWSEYESGGDAIAEARRFRDSRKSQYSDAYKKADKKYRDLQQKQSDAFDKHKALHSKLSVAILEDHAESGHPIKSELAKLHLAMQNSKNPRMYDGVEKKIRQQVTEHLNKIAPAVAFNTEGHGALPADADKAAVNYAISQVANRIMESGPSQFDKAGDLLSGYIRGERLNSYRGIANKKIEALENKNGPSKTHELYNFDDIDKHVTDHVEHDKRVKQQKKAEAAAKKEAKEKFVNDFDAPDAHAEKPHTIGQIGKLLSHASKRIDFYNTARETGWASDGRFMLKLSDKEVAKIPESPHIDGRRLGQGMIDNVTQYQSDASVTGSRMGTVTPVAGRGSTAKTEESVAQVRFGEGKNAIVADAKLHATIMSRYPDAEIKFGKTPGSVVYVSGGQPVGVLLGIVMT